MTFYINTLHRGRFIWILLGGLFLSGFLVSYLQVSEIIKIIILLFCMPVILFLAVKVSLQPSEWTLKDDTLKIHRAGKDQEISLSTISYIKNHLRSGGNLLAIFFQPKRSPIRIWRNKLFSAADDFEPLLEALKSREIEVVIG